MELFFHHTGRRSVRLPAAQPRTQRPRPPNERHQAPFNGTRLQETRAPPPPPGRLDQRRWRAAGLENEAASCYIGGGCVGSRCDGVGDFPQSHDVCGAHRGERRGGLEGGREKVKGGGGGQMLKDCYKWRRERAEWDRSSLMLQRSVKNEVILKAD